MDASNDFNTQVIAAIDDKAAWYDQTQLPKLHEAYRLHLTCINNIIEALEKRSLITPDPYKKDKKITSVQKPDDSPFADNERASKLGIRMGDYQAMVDYVCNYMKFSVAQLTVDKIRRLLELNNTFHWSNLSINSPKANTHALALCLAELKNNAQQLQISMLNDSQHKARESIEEVNEGLKEFAEFRQEYYKGEVRKNVLMNAQFDKSKMSDAASLLAEIKRLFPTCMAKRPFANDLIQQIVEEETGAAKLQRQSATLDKLHITQNAAVKKEDSVDSHELLMDTVRALASTHEQYNVVLEKIIVNNRILESGHNSFKDKLARLFRKAFGLPDPEVEYTITIADSSTGTKRKEKLSYNGFVSNLAKRTKYYASIAAKNAPGYARVNAQDDKAILDFVNRQVTENGRLQVVLAALDEFFKASAPPLERSKVKGIKMELTSLKNILVKTNQYRAEYLAYVEEQEQMKKLGIVDG